MKTFFNVEDLGDLKVALAEAQEVKAKASTFIKLQISWRELQVRLQIA